MIHRGLHPLAQARLSRGLTTAELADRTKVPEEIILAVEAGEQEPDFRTQGYLSGSLGAHPADLFKPSSA